MSYQKFAKLAEQEAAVVLTENDYARLMEHGRVLTISPDHSVYTSYRTYKDFSGKVVTLSLTTRSTDDDGTCRQVFMNMEGEVNRSVMSRNLPKFNGVNLPAVHEDYRGESWPQ